MDRGRGGEQEAVSNAVWTIPNVLSMLRLAGVPVFAWLVYRERLGWAALVLVLSSLTDLADGKIARAYGMTSRLGQLLDPIADRLYIATTLLGLAWVQVIPWWFLVLLVSRDLAILSLYPVVRRHRLPLPEVDFVGKSATFNLLVAFPLLLLGHVEGPWSVACLATGWALAWWGAALYWVAGGIYAWQVSSMAGAARHDEVRA